MGRNSNTLLDNCRISKEVRDAVSMVKWVMHLLINGLSKKVGTFYLCSFYVVDPRDNSAEPS